MGILYICVCVILYFFWGSFFTCCHGLVSVRGGTTLQGAQCMISVLQDRGSRFEFGRGTHEKSLYSHPQIDEKVNQHQISRDLLFHLFGDDYREDKHDVNPNPKAEIFAQQIQVVTVGVHQQTWGSSGYHQISPPKTLGVDSMDWFKGKQITGNLQVIRFHPVIL